MALLDAATRAGCLKMALVEAPVNSDFIDKVFLFTRVDLVGRALPQSPTVD